MNLPKLLYIQRIKVFKEMVEIYQQFLLKFTNALSELEINRDWHIYENTFGTTRDTREFIFIRGLMSWSEIDNISAELSMSEIMAKAYNENEALQWIKIAQKSVKEITTSVLNKIDQYTS